MTKRTQRDERLARIYDDEILPIWSARFGRLLLRDVEIPPRAVVLDVACASGFVSLEVLRRMDDSGRIIAIDESSLLLDVARKKAGELAGKRIFFRTERPAPKLSFTADVYDLVLCNLGLVDLPDPRAALGEFLRVAKPGGRVLCSLPMRGTWDELYDIYREVLIKLDKTETLARLEEHIARLPEPEEAVAWLELGGATEVAIETERFELLFRSAREFFFAPVVELGPLPAWKELSGRGQEMQDVFWNIKSAIDAYFADRAFEVTVVAARISGRKPPLAANPPAEPTGTPPGAS